MMCPRCYHILPFTSELPEEGVGICLFCVSMSRHAIFIYTSFGKITRTASDEERRGIIATEEYKDFQLFHHRHDN